MKIAMDFGGCLREIPALRAYAALLAVNGFEVHVVSAVAEGDPNVEKYRAEIASWGIAFAGVHFVYFAGVPTPDVAYKVGIQKAHVMKAHGLIALYDDNPYICKAVRDAGLLCFQVA